jgi:hypothetical protein
VDTKSNAAVVDLNALLARQPAPRALGIAGLLGALDAAEDLLHADPDELALRDEMTASALKEYLQEMVPVQPVSKAS